MTLRIQGVQRFLCAVAVACAACSPATESRDTAWPEGAPSSRATATDFKGMLRAAGEGDPRAQLLVGLSYFFGEFRDGSKVDQSYDEAERWLRLSANAGNGYAQWQLGGMYSEGIGVTAHQAEAARWFLAAAERGNAGARVNLAIFFLEGTGVEKNYDKAYAWASLAAYCGSENGKRVVRDSLLHLEDKQRADALLAQYFENYGITDPDGESCVRPDVTNR